MRNDFQSKKNVPHDKFRYSDTGIAARSGDSGNERRPFTRVSEYCKLKGCYCENFLSIHIGEYHVTKIPSIIATILGSCVSVCMYDPGTQTGGINHILLPGRPIAGSGYPDASFSENAMETVLGGMLELGANRKRIIAKIFGGASVVAQIPEGDAVGQKIIDSVKKFLEGERIRIAKSDYGGYNSRKIFFHTLTGDVYLKREHPKVRRTRR